MPEENGSLILQKLDPQYRDNFANNHNTTAPFPRTKEKLNLTPLPEMVKPYTKTTTIRPHTFIRRTDITQIPEFTKPNRPYNAWLSGNIKTKVSSQINANTKFGKDSQESNPIETDRPKPFTATSGLFKPPSTLLFGFKPMTTLASFPTTSRPRTNQGKFHPPQNLGFVFIPATPEPITFFRPIRQMGIQTSITIY
jgi:hypothetical protein